MQGASADPALVYMGARAAGGAVFHASIHAQGERWPAGEEICAPREVDGR